MVPLRIIRKIALNTTFRRFSNVSGYLSNLSASQEEIIFDVSRDDKVAFIGLNRPKSKNALGKGLVKQFESAIQYLHKDKTIRCVVIGSLVSNIFCAGADLKERVSIPENEVASFVGRMRNLLQSLADVPIPTICAIDGPALGGGLELALSCDIRIVSENSNLGLVETRLAIIPGAGGTQRLPRLIGVGRAKELMFTARGVSGKEAYNIGLATEAVPQNSDGNAALLHAFLMAQKISCNGPIALRMAKMAIDQGMAVSSVKEALLVEERCYSGVVHTRDRVEGLKAFLEKRKPDYQGA